MEFTTSFAFNPLAIPALSFCGNYVSSINQKNDIFIYDISNDSSWDLCSRFNFLKNSEGQFLFSNCGLYICLFYKAKNAIEIWENPHVAHNDYDEPNTESIYWNVNEELGIEFVKWAPSSKFIITWSSHSVRMLT